MHLLPYLSEEVQDHMIDVKKIPRSYNDTGDMEGPRNPASADEPLPAHALTLTTTNVNGYALIYDTQTCQLTSLEVGDASVDLEGPSYFSRLPFQPPKVILGEWIKAFSTLN